MWAVVLSYNLRDEVQKESVFRVSGGKTEAFTTVLGEFTVFPGENIFITETVLNEEKNQTNIEG